MGWLCALTCKGPMKREQRFKDSALWALRTIKEDTGSTGHMQLQAHTKTCWLRRSSARCITARCPVTSSPSFPPEPATMSTGTVHPGEGSAGGKPLGMWIQSRLVPGAHL